MEIIRKSNNLSAKELYDLTINPNAKRMREAIGGNLEVRAYAIYTDTQQDKEVTVTSILTPDGEIFSTNSPTFGREFEKMLTMFEEMGETVHTIAVTQGRSRAGRDFTTCVYID